MTDEKPIGLMQLIDRIPLWLPVTILLLLIGIFGTLLAFAIATRPTTETSAIVTPTTGIPPADILTIGTAQPTLAQPTLAQQTPAPTFTPFPEADGEEILIIVTDFPDKTIGPRIFDTLSTRLENEKQEADYGFIHIFKDVRLEYLHEIPDSGLRASDIGERYQATLVIWGSSRSGQIIPLYQYTQHEEAFVSYPIIQAYNSYIETDLPAEYEYLMLMTLGQISYYELDYDSALRLFIRATDMDFEPEQAERLDVSAAFFFQGYIFSQWDNVDQSLKAYDQAVQFRPNFSTAYFNRAGVYLFIKGVKPLPMVVSPVNRVQPV